MGRAEDLFQRLIHSGEARVEEFFESRQSEELFLDFKRSADEGQGRKLHDHDLNNLAKAISGFGNSEGGIIVWGVDCNDKNKANVGDFPQARKYIQDPQRFASRLEGSVSGRTVPPHPGVRHHPIIASTGGNEGYVATYVPKSYLAPHQTTGSNDYYIRAGSDFSKTPHGVLAGMFGQHPQPAVSLIVTILYPQFQRKGTRIKLPPLMAGIPNDHVMTHDVASVTLALGLESYGPGLTKDLYMTVKLASPGHDTHIEVKASRRDQKTEGDWTVATSLNDETSLVSTSRYRLAPAASVYPVHMDCQFIPPFLSDFSYTITYGYQGSPVQTTQVTVDKEVIIATWKSLLEGVSEAKDFAYLALGLDKPRPFYKGQSI
ncbi:MAG: AlbA family DNA-binding domain-containing protein [Janthinobacterium lividum]